MRNFLIFVLIISSLYSMAGVKISGVPYSSVVVVKKDTLQLNGVGIREKWFIDLYTAGLYIKEKSSNAQEIIDCDCLQAFKIVFVSKLISTEKFNDAIDEVFIKSTQGNTKHIDSRIATFKKSLGTGLSAGDELFLIYKPNTGLKVFRNGIYKDTILGLDFKKELMKLWVGEHAINESLKNKILGKV